MKRTLQIGLGIASLGLAIFLALQWSRIVTDDLPTSLILDTITQSQASGDSPNTIIAELPDRLLGVAALEHRRRMNTKVLFFYSILGLVLSGASLTCLGMWKQQT